MSELPWTFIAGGTALASLAAVGLSGARQGYMYAVFSSVMLGVHGLISVT